MPRAEANQANIEPSPSPLPDESVALDPQARPEVVTILRQVWKTFSPSCLEGKTASHVLGVLAYSGDASGHGMTITVDKNPSPFGGPQADVKPF
jgi:hypothetical protein